MTLLALMFSGCYYDVAEDLYPEEGPCDTVLTTYSGTIKPLITNQCLGCHPNFDNYNEIKTRANVINDLINRDVNASGFMPKGGSKLNACDLKKFQLWIDKGYPQ